MSVVPLANEFPEEDLIDRIAKAMPADVRADYYRELIHCRSLPQSDEMLHILRIMQILTFLIHRAPETVVVERERLEQLCGRLIEILEETNRSIEQYQARLDERLAQLPEEIADQIQPEAIARVINESLQQQFRQSTIPATGRALEIIARRMDNALAGFSVRVERLEDAHRDAAEEVRRTNETVRRESERLSREYRWPFYALAGFLLLMTFLFGAAFQRWWDSPAAQADRTIAPVTQPSPPIKQPGAAPKARR